VDLRDDILWVFAGKQMFQEVPVYQVSCCSLSHGLNGLTQKYP